MGNVAVAVAVDGKIAVALDGNMWQWLWMAIGEVVEALVMALGDGWPL